MYSKNVVKTCLIIMMQQGLHHIAFNVAIKLNARDFNFYTRFNNYQLCCCIDIFGWLLCPIREYLCAGAHFDNLEMNFIFGEFYKM